MRKRRDEASSKREMLGGRRMLGCKPVKRVESSSETEDLYGKLLEGVRV